MPNVIGSLVQPFFFLAWPAVLDYGASAFITMIGNGFETYIGKKINFIDGPFLICIASYVYAGAGKTHIQPA